MEDSFDYNGVTIHPNGDGVTHINIYSRAKTELGQWLSNFQYSPVNVKGDGMFVSMEAYYHYLKAKLALNGNECSDETMRTINFIKCTHGPLSKNTGSKLRRMLFKEGFPMQDVPSDKFNELFNSALLTKFKNNISKSIEYIDELENGTIFLHYYVTNDNKVIYEKRFDWLLERLEDIKPSIIKHISDHYAKTV